MNNSSFDLAPLVRTVAMTAGMTAALIFAGPGCVTVRVTTDYDTAYRFSKLRTYAWLPVSTERTVRGEPVDDRLLENRIRGAVERELAVREYVKVSNDPDFFVHWSVSVDKALDIQTYPAGHVAYSRAGYGWAASADVIAREYEEGTLMIDVVDAETDALVWRGAGTRALAHTSDPNRRTEIVNDAVFEIMADFPPGR